MKIRQIKERKKQYLDLLLLADEQEDMIDRYLSRGEMFVLEDNGVKAECVVTKEGEGLYEIKNLAVCPMCQRRGYGRALIQFLFERYTDCETMIVGTGDSILTIPFYERCGFQEFKRVKNFFTDYYDHPIFEGGKQLVDMVYLMRKR
ncbi:MAG: GNAT family N-acetyltransferase [Eubacteriales bacterium]|nr:GNAT family N-acetyltransferase [Eubacteriales bacterium]